MANRPDNSEPHPSNPDESGGGNLDKERLRGVGDEDTRGIADDDDDEFDDSEDAEDDEEEEEGETDV
jgi:hypothetical protein